MNITKAHAANRAAGAERAAALVEDIEWMLQNRACEHAILVATGYAQKPEALKRKLHRLGRGDLAPRVFEWDASRLDRRISQ